MKLLNKIGKNKGLIAVFFIPVWVASFFVLSFINSKGCNQIVIDSYEVRSGINIPDVSSSICDYDPEKDVRMSLYTLNTNVDNYLRNHNAHADQRDGFKLTNAEDVNFILPLGRSQAPVSKQLYVSTGTKWGNTWQYVVEKETGRLWVEMKYTPTVAAGILEMITWIIFHLPVLFLALYLYRILKKLLNIPKRSLLSQR